MQVCLLSDRVRINPHTGMVLPRDAPTSAAAHALEANFAASHILRALREGTASFQVVVSVDTPSDGADIALRVTPFSGPNGSMDRVTIYYEWPCRIAENEWTFEALIPLTVYQESPVAVRRGPLGPRTHHGFWIDVFVERETAPGRYRGQVIVEGAAPLELTLEVLPVTLPLIPRVTVDLNSYSEALHTRHHPGLTGPDQIECERSYYREGHDNRAVLHYLPYDHSGNVTTGYAPPLVGRGKHLRVADWSAYDARFGPLFDGTAMAGSPGGARPIPHWYLPFNYDWPADFAAFGTRGYDEEFVRIMTEFRRHFQAKGWTQTNFEVYFNHKKRYRFYAWDGDERKHEADKRHFLHFRYLMDRAAMLAGREGAQARILNRTDISWSFAHDSVDEQMATVFDMWVAGSGNFSWTRFGVEAIKARGQIAWWYGGIGGPDRPTMDADRQVILCWRRGADGFLASWLNMAVDEMLDTASELSMLYPGRRFGWDRALGSIRLRRVRAATETADVLEMLGDRGKKLVDTLANATDDDWWTPTPAWTLYPPEVMNNEMYGFARNPMPLAVCDVYTPAVIREQALDLAVGR